jgi:hypothetical protein
MIYWLAKRLFPKQRADVRIRRMNLIILVAVFSILGGGILVAVMLGTYSRLGK